MREFRGTAAEFSETAEMDAPEKGAWSAFDPPELDELGMDLPERPDAGIPPAFPGSRHSTKGTFAPKRKRRRIMPALTAFTKRPTT